MIRLLQWVFFGHVHKWKTLSTATLWGKQKDRPIGQAYVQQCEHCGTVRRKDLVS